MTAASASLAVCGKGGTGKTVISALLTAAALDRGLRVLAVDADPALGLVSALGQAVPRTVAGVRAELVAHIRNAGGDPKQDLLEHLDYLVGAALVERGRLGLLAMGASDGPGCFCGVNRLLREVLEAQARTCDLVVVDGEAGLEQVNREVLRRVGGLVLVCDASRRAVDTAIGLAARSRKHMPGLGSVGVVVNRAAEVDPALARLLGDASLPVLAVVPEDAEVRRRDVLGEPLTGLPADSPARQAVDTLLVAHRDALGEIEVEPC